MRKLIATIMLTSIMFNNSIANDNNNNDNLSIGGKYYTSKGISVKNLSIPNETFLKYSGRGGYSAKNEGCSAVSRLYSQLGLSMDLDAVKNLFNNWKSLALPVSLYALATQFPYVKEVLVSSQYASDFLAKLGGTNCDSAFNFVNKVNGVSPSAVSSCMKHWSSVCDKSGDPNKCYLEHCGIHKSWYELISGKEFASMLSDPSAKHKVEEALAMINPKTTISCALGLPALPEDMSSTQFQQSARNISAGKGIPLVASRTLLTLLATIPSVSIQSRGMGLKIPKIDGKVMSMTRGLNLLQTSMTQDLDALLAKLDKAESLADIKTDVDAFTDKYGIELQNADAYFEAFKYVGDKLSSDCPAMDSEACVIRTQAYGQAKDNIGELMELEYALSVKQALIDYIEQTKLYLLQQKNTGLAVCSSLAGKKLDLSDKNVKAMVQQLNILENQVKSETDSFFAEKGVSEKDIGKLSLKVVKDLAKAVDGKDHKEGEWVSFTVD